MQLADLGLFSLQMCFPRWMGLKERGEVQFPKSREIHYTNSARSRREEIRALC